MPITINYLHPPINTTLHNREYDCNYNETINDDYE